MNLYCFKWKKCKSFKITIQDIGKNMQNLCLDKVEAKGGEGCEGQCDGVKFQEE